MSRLTDFPGTISQLQYNLLSVEDQIFPVKDEIAELEAEFDAIVAFDSELKNDTQRKARRSELATKNSWYKELTLTLVELVREKAKLTIELELCRNQFTVAKLEARREIALVEERASA